MSELTTDTIESMMADLRAHLDELREIHEVVYEDGDVVVFSDEKGYELNELREDYGDDVEIFMHDEANELVGDSWNWSTTWPVVVRKD